ncbi:MAG: hypothetical protein GC157_04355 [Frankiales bacterium]|nr:hypothetical protein [Frankiales bacterium]
MGAPRGGARPWRSCTWSPASSSSPSSRCSPSAASASCPTSSRTAPRWPCRTTGCSSAPTSTPCASPWACAATAWTRWTTSSTGSPSRSPSATRASPSSRAACAARACRVRWARPRRPTPPRRRRGNRRPPRPAEAPVADPSDGTVLGEDGVRRCAWGASTAEYRAYHDTEWGRPVHGDEAVFERITLEAFQSGLAWITILRKREAFRAAFDRFRIPVVAAYGEAERERLLADAGIVRNRAKVDATIRNARAAADLLEAEGEGALDRLVWSFAPPPGRPRPRRGADVVATTPESTALSRELKRRGFVFVGPTTMHAAMQAMGLLDDHLAACEVVVG